MKTKQSIYTMQQLQPYDQEMFDTCWQYNDQRRNAKLDRKYNLMQEVVEREQMDEVRRECKQLWLKQKLAVQKNASEPMACHHPRVKKCYNHHCLNEVNWQWASEKNFCAGDRCVQQLVPGVTHKMQMNCINMELKRYWEDFEREIDSVSSPTQDLSYSSPTSVSDIEIEDEGMFSMEDIMPLDLHEIDLYCHETLLFNLEDLECDAVLN